MSPDQWVVGDVQGFLEPLLSVLSSVGLVGDHREWIGDNATLTVLGDLVDRGPDGVGVIEFLMQLQQEGHVDVVIGNHDILLLAAHQFGSVTSTATARTFFEDWELSGGQRTDLERLTESHVAWLKSLPAMRLERDVLMMHADALFYLDYGSSVDDVNARFGDVLHGDDVTQWDHLLDAMTRQPPETATAAYVYCGGRCVNVDPGLYLGGPGFAYRL